MTAPATPTERRLWALAQLRPRDPFYNVPFVVSLDGPLDRTALERALTEVVRRHPALRTTLRQVDGELTRFVDPAGPVAPETGDVDAHAFAQEPFDLARGPLLRTRLVRDDDRSHRLFVTVHHVVFDGASHDIFLDELARLYDAFSRGEPSPLADPPPHVPRQADTLAHWTERLAGIPPVTPLPLKGPRPASSGYRNARRSRLIPAEVVEPLRAVARRRRASMFMLLKAACDVLLHQHGAHDVVMGVPTSGRDTVESAGVIGYLVKTVVTRTRFTGDPTFTEVLAHVRGDVLDAQEHADLPFEELLRALDVPRDPGYDPLYQVLFGYETTPVARLGGGVRFSSSYLALDTAKADLDILLSDTGTGFHAHLDHRTDLFDADTVDLLLVRLETLLRRIGRDPDARVSDLVRPDEPELAVLREWERSGQPPGEDAHVLFERLADRSPAAVAVEARGRVWTYGEVEASANRVAHRLRADGAGRVAVCLPLSGELAAAVLGVFKAGGTCVLLDPARPPYLLRALAQDAEVSLVLSDSHHESVFEQAPVVRVDSLDGPTDRVGASGVGTSGGAGFVAHTSEARGVRSGYRVLGDLLAWARRELPAEAFACASPIGSPASGTALFELSAALTTGGRVSDEPRAATLVCATPPVLARLVRSGGLSSGGPGSGERSSGERSSGGPRVAVISTGAVLQPSLVRALHDTGRVRSVHNAYAVAGVFATGGVVRPGEAVTIGRPVGSVAARVLDGRGHPVPPGVVGRLHLDGVATADRVRHTADGRLEVVDEAADVEAAALAHPGVHEACVLADGAPAGGVLAAVAAATSAEVHAHLRSRLPGYLVPSRVVVVPDLPLGPDGTVDRHALGRAVARTPVRVSHEPPATDAERRVAQAWTSLLGRSVDVNQNFFEVGGNSLLIVRLREELNTAFGLDLPVADLFRHPTVRTMSQLVVGGGATSAVAGAGDRARTRRDALARRSRGRR